MNYITTTQLRSKTPFLVNALAGGTKIMLMHRSKIIGEIGPIKSENPSIKNIQKFGDFLNSIAPKKPLSRQKERMSYIKHLLGKYG